MEKEELIELNGEEYAVVLNRQSLLKIEQYTNLQKSMNEIRKENIKHIEEIKENEDPFAEEIDIDKMQEEADKKLNLLKKIIVRAFWIWLYPRNKFNVEKVESIINPYFEDDEEKTKFISELYGRLLQESSQISDKYIQEQKNLKAQTNK